MASSAGFLSSLINVDIIVFISLAQTDRNRSLIDYTKHKKKNDVVNVVHIAVS